MKLKATVELEISERERKRIAIEYLRSLIPHDHSLRKEEDNYYWAEHQRDHDNTVFYFKKIREATPFEVNLYKVLEELKK